MMELHPKRKSDDEYIASIRRQVRYGKRYAIVQCIGFFVSIALYMIILRLVLRVYQGIPGVTETLPLGVILGIPFGIVFMFLLSMVAFCGVSARRCLMGNRTEHLMLKFHDQLQMNDEGASNKQMLPIAASHGSGRFATLARKEKHEQS